MFRVVPFDHKHLFAMLDQRGNPADHLLRTGRAVELENGNYAKTILYYSRPMVCGGIITLWPGRGQLWAVFNEESKYHPVPLFRTMNRFLDEAPVKRIEMAQEPGFEHGARRALMMGFVLECPFAREYFEDGSDAELYSRIRTSEVG